MVIVVVATTFISPLLSLRKSFQRFTFSGSLYKVSTANRLNVETLKAGQNAESIARCKCMVWYHPHTIEKSIEALAHVTIMCD